MSYPIYLSADFVNRSRGNESFESGFPLRSAIPILDIIQHTDLDAPVHTWRTLVFPIKREGAKATFLGFIAPMTSAASEAKSWYLIPLALIVDALFAPLRFVVGPFALGYHILKGEELRKDVSVIETILKNSGSELGNESIPDRVNLGLRYSFQIENTLALQDRFPGLPSGPVIARGSLRWEGVPVRPTLTGIQMKKCSITFTDLDNRIIRAKENVLPSDQYASLRLLFESVQN